MFLSLYSFTFFIYSDKHNVTSSCLATFQKLNFVMGGEHVITLQPLLGYPLKCVGLPE